MMQVFRAVSAALLLVLAAGSAAFAQSGPQEAPPPGYSANQYVDSAGCVYIRAGLGGQVTWVQRLKANREPVCGLTPSLATSGPEAEAQPAAAAPAAQTAPQSPARPAATAPKSAKKTPVRATMAAKQGVRLVQSRAVPRADTHCTAPIRQAQRHLLSDGRRVTQCRATPVDNPVEFINALNLPGLVVEPGLPGKREAHAALAADRGQYRVVWTGVGPEDAEIAAPTRATAPQHPERQPAGPGKFVQVGAFAEPANADRAIRTLKSLGLPVASAREPVKGRPARSILAGPFTDAGALSAALHAAREAGYRDAFIRG